MSDLHMPAPNPRPGKGATTRAAAAKPIGEVLQKAGTLVAATGIGVVLATSGFGKFTTDEIEGLKPVFSGSLLLSWLPPTFGDAGSSYALGVGELTTAALIAASPFSRRAGIAGGALATMTFAVTTSLLFSATPSIWEEKPGGIPEPSSWGFFLLKDVVLLGAAMVVLGSNLERPGKTRGRRRR